MKTYLAVFFTAAMLASMAFGADRDPFQEERFKAKTGRYTLAEETRRQALAQLSNTRTEECIKPNCCRHKHVATRRQVTEKVASTDSVLV